ncbi:MAG: LacI family DNA-binding transcriptional regulator [Planctomycetota bacterium]
MASIRAIAKSAGVSVATVSRTLNNLPDVSDKTRSKVMRSVEKLGYDPAAQRRRPVLIGLAYPGQPVNPEFGGFDAAIISGVTRGVDEHKFDVALLNVQRDKQPHETYSQFFRRKHVAGVVLRSFSDTRHLCEAIAEEGFPHIVVADHFDHPDVNFICNDSYPDTLVAMEHLASLGHKRVGMCIHMVRDSDHDDRRRAYHESVDRFGLDTDPRLIAEVIADMNGGATAINSLMSLPQPPTAVLITDPLASLGAMHRCLELSINVPEELSIVGFDDSGARRMAYPVYTSICQDSLTLGQRAAEWLSRKLMDQGDPVCRVRDQTFFEVNQTTAPPTAKPARVMPNGQRLAVTV